MMKRVILSLLLAFVACRAWARSARESVCNLIFIGNSITEGVLHADKAKTAPPVAAAEFVGRMTSGEVHFRNCGRSGATTVDFLPARNADFRRVEQAVSDLRALDASAPFVVSIMLGTNDSASSGPTGAPVSDEEYAHNLETIISRIRELCPGAIFVLQRPIWYSPNTYNGSVYLVEGQRRLEGYADVLLSLAEKYDDVYPGDRSGYDYFRSHYRKYCFPEEGNAGVFYLHPNEKGARRLGKLWARAIAAVLQAAGSK